jgi:hypothetical protein
MLLLRGIPNLTTELTDEVFVATNAVAIKLGALRYHQQKYEEIQVVRMREISDDENTKNAIQRGIKFCPKNQIDGFKWVFSEETEKRLT